MRATSVFADLQLRFVRLFVTGLVLTCLGGLATASWQVTAHADDLALGVPGELMMEDPGMGDPPPSFYQCGAWPTYNYSDPNEFEISGYVSGPENLAGVTVVISGVVSASVTPDSFGFFYVYATIPSGFNGIVTATVTDNGQTGETEIEIQN